MISRSVLFTDFFKGNWTILALVDHCAFQKSPICYVLLPCQEITHRTHLFSPQYQTPEICFFRYCCFPPAVTHPLMGSTALSLCFSFQERRPLTCSTWHYLFRVSGRIVIHCHNFCAYDAFSLQHQWILLFFPPKKKKLIRNIFLSCQTTVIIFVSHIDQMRFARNLSKMNYIMNYVLLLEKHGFFFCHVLQWSVKCD